MSTRSQVIIKDQDSEQWFYRHSDGYPEGNMPILRKFIQLVRDGKIRNNVSQGSGWLTVLGMIEYQSMNPAWFPEFGQDSWKVKDSQVGQILATLEPTNWKQGSYEPEGPGRHGDIEFIYIVDMNAGTVTGYETSWDDPEGLKDRQVCQDTPEKPWKGKSFYDELNN